MLHLLSSLTLVTDLAIENDSTELRREKLMDALRSGGYTVLLRHARTDRAFNEQRDPVPTARQDQRNLTDDGIKDAALIGVVFRKYGIQFAEIVSSPMYRTVETAEYSVDKPTSTTMALTPCSLSTGTSWFAVSTSSLNSRPSTPAWVTMSGVASSVMPMKPILAPLKFFT